MLPPSRLIAAVTGLLLGGVARAAFSPLIVALVINGTPQGDLIIQQDEDGRYYLPYSAFAEFAQLPAQTPVTMIGGEAHVAADAIAGTEISFDPETLSLALTLPAIAFAPQHFSLARQQRRRAPLSDAGSLLLNYRIDVFGGEVRKGWQLRSDQAWRLGSWLLSNDVLGSRFEGQRETVRLLSRAQHEDIGTMRKIIIGDERGRAGDALDSSQIIGGITLRRAFELTPGLIRFPTAGIAASTASPADIELYVGDDRVFRGQVEPGPFRIADFNYYGGLQTLRLVVRDASGAVRVIEQPHYFTSRGLAAGISDFEWRLGFLREEFGSRSADYGDVVAGGFHRYGLSDRLTVGGRIQAGPGDYNVGASLVYTSPWLGLLGLSTAASRQRELGGGGAAVNLEYQLQAGPYALLLFGRWAEPDYRSFGQDPDSPGQNRLYGATLGLGTGRFGSLSLAVTRRRDATAGQQTDLRLSAGRGFPSGLAFDISASRRTGQAGDEEILLNLRYRFGREATLSSSLGQVRGDARQWQLQAFSDRPHGTGFAWRASELQLRRDGQDSAAHELLLRHQAPYLSWEGAYSETETGLEDLRGWRLGAGGSLAWTHGRLSASRRVEDAFALVEITPPLERVRVYHNSRLVGRTDEQGRLFVPELISLIDNAVTIEEQDIPFHYSIDAIQLAVAPRQRGGALLRFPLRAVRAVSGGLVHAASGEALQHRSVSLQTLAGPRQFVSGYGGRFYIEDLPPGDYPASLKYENMICRFTLRVPDDGEPFTELGRLSVCKEAVRDEMH